MTCSCGQPSTPCNLCTDYGGGFWWDGAVCLTCRCITDGLSPFGVSGSWGVGWGEEPREMKDGHPLMVAADPPATVDGGAIDDAEEAT